MSDRTITYSPAFTLVPTYECFNRCTYCNFRQDIGTSGWLSLEAAAQQLAGLDPQQVREILILSGEVAPNSPQRSQWLERLYDLAALALDQGFLPHTNAGPLNRAEMAALKAVNVSMGLMLEQLTPKLLQSVHRHAPSKDPQLRLHQLEQAGELGIPFTTGLLLGIGEEPQDWAETLTAIAECHRRWGHIQEVILQPHSPGQQQEAALPPFDLRQLPNVVHWARSLLPEDITIQIPANLVTDPEVFRACLNAGARDLGGIVPLDHVNPDYPHTDVTALREQLQAWGWELVPRLPVYPQFVDGLPPPLRGKVKGMPV
ncbi:MULTISPECIES: 7,8-didemethyl-8-hydroxy-5-deazariboflavin synthase subunit CofG [unclassified Thermosynechococcus]|uniref:7,8-didemethyl-8-hydroxy-5-deazariboflavin synthase subunit CofG n=1 Tax=unclassified Thermosynechococcus TaxID=2622553 RepID=UPI0026715356|nr:MULTISPECIES: 7,8-didemethyl-8-hydroxy-5-deazariboflavin synthase subunit CofG [unclassified Thermosynechococcus]MDR5640134.1 7,8-didemethyl-8-hydroxy-5-deazariboflavin synthase subunit CofG [Thermosynechococcus sp. PP42]MDR7897439.1 7,8-didemethyl-8-hydroxy-5-deazariboflavin synthase subunit CofG [Thermosynechococcus sp. JY1332]MDR7904844.1 7,8-didemethyl-8-hydroxy-5-deazariboflavin synthase subunit CofG [Thermosynechococcus sp. JY1334]MDR7992669.1 7,8-didemethyl-8-hydroxy-5-deazariboflavin